MKTADITLWEATPKDAQKIFDAIDTHREDLRIWLPFVDKLETVENEKDFLQNTLQIPKEMRDTLYIIYVSDESGEAEGIKNDAYVEETNDKFAGIVSYVKNDPANSRTEIGYWLLPEFRGKGIMTRSVKRLCKMAVNERSMHRIQIRCALGNHASNHIPIRLGFKLEGTERDGELLIGNRYTDINVYSILEHEVNAWPEESVAK